jgi:hypothetical protein
VPLNALKRDVGAYSKTAKIKIRISFLGIGL